MGHDDNQSIDDITVVVLRQIRDEIIATRTELTATRTELTATRTELTARIDNTNERLDSLNGELHSFKLETRENFAKVTERVERIEKHLKL